MVDRLVADARRLIGEYGVMVTAVFPGVRTVGFAYTAGLTAAGEPELVLTGGIPPVFAKQTLNDLAFRVLKGGVRFKPGDQPPDVLADDYEVAICGPTVPHPDYPLAVAEAIYGPVVRVYQVVYQDRRHLFPWQEGYDMEGQFLLGGGHG